MSSFDKRKHKTLSAEAGIIRKLDNGEKFVNLAKEYGVGAIYDIKNKRILFCDKYRQWPYILNGQKFTIQTYVCTRKINKWNKLS
jgi:hypothetical protein